MRAQALRPLGVQSSPVDLVILNGPLSPMRTLALVMDSSQQYRLRGKLKINAVSLSISE
jgi:hypothetical protein